MLNIVADNATDDYASISATRKHKIVTKLMFPVLSDVDDFLKKYI